MHIPASSVSSLGRNLRLSGLYSGQDNPRPREGENAGSAGSGHLVPVFSSTTCARHRFPRTSRTSTMQASPQRPKGRDGVLSTLSVTIEALNLAKEVCGITPAKAAFGSVSALLTMIRVCFLLSCGCKLLAHISLGVNDQRARLCQPRLILR